MSQKFQKEVLDLAKKRGWKVVRKGGHEQTILQFPHTGARATIWATPRSSPSIGQITTKLASLEVRSRNAQLDKALDWLCHRYGIADGGSGTFEARLTDEMRAFLGAQASEQEVRSLTSALAHSDRLWLAGFSVRGGSTPKKTPRILLGRDSILSKEQMAIVEMFPQVNNVIPNNKSGSEVRAEMAAFLKERGWRLNKSSTWTHIEKGLYQFRIGDAFTASQDFPVVETPTYQPWANARKNGGVIAVEGEEKGVKALPALVPNLDGPGDTGPSSLDILRDPSLRVPEPEPTPVIDQFAGMPPELAAGLRAFLKVDNKNVISGIEMVYDALDKASYALDELRAALDLIKVSEG